jgi:hypothetical protein
LKTSTAQQARDQIARPQALIVGSNNFADVLSPLMRAATSERLNWGWREERSIGTNGYHVARA